MVLFLIAVAFLSEAHQTITVFLNQLQYERCGLRSSSIGLIYIAATILGALGIYSSAVCRRMERGGRWFSFAAWASLPV